MWRRLKRVITEVNAIRKKPEMKVLPGHLAFFLMLSIVPTITLIGYIARMFGLSTTVIVDFLSKSFSQETADLLVPILIGKTVDIKIFLIIFTGYVIASNGAHSIIIASNTIYNINESSLIRRRIKAVYMTTFIVTLMLFLIVVPVFGNKILSLLISLDPAIEAFESIFPFLSLPLTIFMIFIFVKIIYTMAPDKKIPSFTVNSGTIFTTIGIVIVTEIYTYYVHNLSHYDLFYGGLTNIVMVMIWLYFLSYVLVIGIALNYSSEKKYLENLAEVEELEQLAKDVKEKP